MSDLNLVKYKLVYTIDGKDTYVSKVYKDKESVWKLWCTTKQRAAAKGIRLSNVWIGRLDIHVHNDTISWTESVVWQNA